MYSRMASSSSSRLRHEPRVRRLVNQRFFDKLLISLEDDEPTVAGPVLREPWATLLAEEFLQQMARHAASTSADLDVHGLTERSLVPPVGVEPTLSEV